MTQPPPPSASVSQAHTQANSLLEVSPAFSNLGSTTKTRSWVALGAVVLVLLAALSWGLFGTVTLQQTMGGISVSNGLPYEISIPKAGRIGRLGPEGHVYSQGDEIASVLPYDGGPVYSVKAPARMLVTGWETVLGSPVTPEVPIGRGVLLGLQPEVGGVSTNDPLVAVTFVPLVDYQGFAEAVSIEVAVLNLGGEPTTYPAKMVSFSAYPSSEARIAQITGSPTLAANVMEVTGGEAYFVALGFENPDDAQAVAAATQSADPRSITSGQAATILLTKVSSNPLEVLFGSGL